MIKLSGNNYFTGKYSVNELIREMGGKMSEYKVSLDIKNLTKTFPQASISFLRQGGNGRIGLKEIDLIIYRSEVFAFMGEAQSGLDTLRDCLSGHIRPNRGKLILHHTDLLYLPPAEFKQYIAKISLISSKNRRPFPFFKTVRSALKKQLQDQFYQTDDSMTGFIKDLLQSSGLDESSHNKWIKQLNPLQKLQLGLASASIQSPFVIILDRPTLNLNSNQREELVQLINKFRKRMGLTIILIDNDMDFLDKAADRIAVMLKDRIVEVGNTADILKQPLHPYVKKFFNSLNNGLDQNKRSEKSQKSREKIKEHACPFSHSCEWARKICFHQFPEMKEHSTHRQVACHYYETETLSPCQKVIPAFNVAI